MIEFDAGICSDLAEASSREWIETNGIGGYASSTIAGAHTRRYHGLLVASTKPPLGRIVMLSRFEETLIINDQRFELSCNRYPGTVYPNGYRFLTGFRLDPFPIWTYEVDGVTVEKRLFMAHGENTTVMTWAITSGRHRAVIELKPLLAFRDHHHLQHENTIFDGSYAMEDDAISFQPYAEMPPMYISSNAVKVEQTGVWYRNFEYEIEHERGFDFHEDLFQPCNLTFELSQPVVVIASTDSKRATESDALAEREIARREKIVSNSGSLDAFTSALVLAADQFIVGRGEGKTVIAGYHWFSDWGRDTMIALPGLALATNQPEIAKSIIVEFSLHLSEGMIPNRFPDHGEEPDYNTVDATLWYFEAIRAYIEKTSDYELVRNELYDKLVDVIDWHICGTRFQIKVDDDGLLYAGEPGVQLTWMDAKIGDWVVTPRTGKAVEIQALWYNALMIMAALAERFGDGDHNSEYLQLAAKAKSSFNEKFWNEAEDCLYDVINGSDRDGSVRPNQIFAVSLTHQIVNSERAVAIVNKVEAELLTPYGLRSLSPNDERFAPNYIGSPPDRDAAYHQGTVWGWLIGGFVDAYRKVHQRGKTTDDLITEMLSNFEVHLTSNMAGQISEIFDGSAPHLARGCAAQAWSVAELLRVAQPGLLLEKDKL